MMTAADSANYELPYKDAEGFCNILFSALGGDGANMAAKLLFKLGVELFDLDGGYDAKYGSEKKGTPTDVSLRFCQLGTAMRSAGPTIRPHFLVAFRQNLIRPLELNSGLQAGATVIVNTTKSPDEIRQIVQLHSGTIICLDASDIAARTNSRLNMPMMAMLSNQLKFSPDAVKEKIAKQWPKAAEANIAAYDAAVESAQQASFEDDGKYQLQGYKESRDERLGYLNILNGGAIDNLKFSTVTKSNRLGGTGFYPKFDQDACITCGMCLSVCSDPGSLVWKDQKMTGINKDYCKGCMRCVQICPKTKKGKALQYPSVEAKAVVGGTKE